MIKVNLKFSKYDSLAEFLLRFGIMENPNWYVDKKTELEKEAMAADLDVKTKISKHFKRKSKLPKKDKH